MFNFITGLVLGIVCTFLITNPYIVKNKSVSFYNMDDDIIASKIELDEHRFQGCLSKDFPEVGINKCSFLMMRRLYIQSLTFKDIPSKVKK